MWGEGKRHVPFLDLNDNVGKALAFARRCGSLRVGLEQIQTILEMEEAGLALKQKKLQEPLKDKLEIGENISRVMLMSNDGADRFYRHSETILNRYSHRLLGVKLNISSLALGHIFYGRDNKAVKAIFVDRKDAVLRVLSSFLS